MISSGVVEEFSGKAKLTARKAYGLRTPQGIEIAMFHPMGNLPEPKISHRFCRGAFFGGQLQRAVSANGKKGTKTAKAELEGSTGFEPVTAMS